MAVLIAEEHPLTVDLSLLFERHTADMHADTLLWRRDLLDRGRSIAVVEEVVRGGIDDHRALGAVERPPSLATDRFFFRTG